MNSGAKGAANFFGAWKMVNPPPKKTTWSVMISLNPLDALIPKLPFSQILGSGHLRGPGVRVRKIFGVPLIEHFWRGFSQRAVSTPPLEARPPKAPPETSPVLSYSSSPQPPFLSAGRGTSRIVLGPGAWLPGSVAVPP